MHYIVIATREAFEYKEVSLTVIRNTKANNRAIGRNEDDGVRHLILGLERLIPASMVPMSLPPPG